MYIVHVCYSMYTMHVWHGYICRYKWIYMYMYTCTCTCMYIPYIPCMYGIAICVGTSEYICICIHVHIHVRKMKHMYVCWKWACIHHKCMYMCMLSTKLVRPHLFYPKTLLMVSFIVHINKNNKPIYAPRTLKRWRLWTF